MYNYTCFLIGKILCAKKPKEFPRLYIMERVLKKYIFTASILHNEYTVLPHQHSICMRINVYTYCDLPAHATPNSIVPSYALYTHTCKCTHYQKIRCLVRLAVYNTNFQV